MDYKTTLPESLIKSRHRQFYENHNQRGNEGATRALSHRDDKHHGGKNYDDKSSTRKAVSTTTPSGRTSFSTLITSNRTSLMPTLATARANITSKTTLSTTVSSTSNAITSTASVASIILTATAAQSIATGLGDQPVPKISNNRSDASIALVVFGIAGTVFALLILVLRYGKKKEYLGGAPDEAKSLDRRRSEGRISRSWGGPTTTKTEIYDDYPIFIPPPTQPGGVYYNEKLEYDRAQPEPPLTMFPQHPMLTLNRSQNAPGSYYGI
ncbi:hypothetical protein BP6252_06560 [Coleophoma cylindrospora]|uniref:Uncharacterized protein n=1 Tax=Coleophoma cylindrospora TaxID=1849047 RepID=A0A3D8RN99_9HELO|nr:hypothetical protein BP6252_06560 [Coleophoma cylindrospora]